jgi:hypothetical protein
MLGFGKQVTKPNTDLTEELTSARLVELGCGLPSDVSSRPTFLSVNSNNGHNSGPDLKRASQRGLLFRWRLRKGRSRNMNARKVLCYLVLSLSCAVIPTTSYGQSTSRESIYCAKFL